MTPEQYTAIRRKFFPDDPTAFLMEMGYTGNRSTLYTRARRFESGEIPIPENVARFAYLLDEWSTLGCLIDPTAKPDDLPDWPAPEIEF